MKFLARIDSILDQTNYSHLNALHLDAPRLGDLVQLNLKKVDKKCKYIFLLHLESFVALVARQTSSSLKTAKTTLTWISCKMQRDSLSFMRHRTQIELRAEAAHISTEAHKRKDASVTGCR